MTKVIVRHRIVDKLVGDEVMGVSIPPFTRDGHFAAAMVEDAKEILRSIGYGKEAGPVLDVVIGLEAGPAFIGVVGRGEVNDFTVLGPAFFDPELKGRGIARLAAMTRVPVIPMGLWGTEQVWPRSARLPRITPGRRHPVTVRIGPRVGLTYDDPDTDTKRVMAAITDLLPLEARKRRTPTEEELRRTFPPGYHGDPAHETDRRPGRDV